MTKLQKKFFVGAGLLTLMVYTFSCEEGKRTSGDKPNPPVPPPAPPPSCSASPINLNYASQCTIGGACTFTFSCTNSTQSSLIVSSRDLISRVGEGSIPKTASSAQFTISSITTIGTPALLQTTPGAVDNKSFAANSPLDCTIDDSALTITCTKFAPLADHFTMAGKIGDKTINLDIMVDASGIIRATPGNVAICGRYGVADTNANHYTTEQRMYDCSKRVTDFAGIGNGVGGFKAFASGNPNPNWFLVSCYDTDSEHCSWLTPVVLGSLATTTSNEYLSTVNGTQGALTNTLVDTRFLWSGVLSSGTYSFFQANGKNPWNMPNNSLTEGRYDYYLWTSDNAIAQRNVASDAQMCAPSTNTACSGMGGTSLDFSYNSIYTALPSSLTSICERQTGVDSALISANSYTWQMPSYPMIMMITGGKSGSPLRGSCESGGFQYDNNQHAYCLSTANPPSTDYLGFRAIDPIPSFRGPFWSSSADFNGGGWIFNGQDNGMVNINIFSVSQPVRCASPVW